MRSLQDYAGIFREIASNLNLQGDSVEVLVQMLSNATYISEVEHIGYMKESSLEKCSIMNSKIQHCVDLMYSVYRGLCPRVILNFTVNKYMKFDLFDVVTTSNNFKLYYSGYYDDEEGKLIKSSCTLNPDVNYQIECILASEVVDKDWKVTKDNLYYIDCEESDLSNDVSLLIRSGSEADDSGFSRIYQTTNFSDHILNSQIFDLTLPGFGSRLFLPEDYKVANTEIKATFFKQSSLSDYNEAELKRIRLDGVELKEFSGEFMKKYKFDDLGEMAEGLLYIDSIPSDTLETIHYKANRDRFVNSILRSNSDIGTILEKTYPDKIRANGTSHLFLDNSLIIYYIPYDILNPIFLTEEDINSFISKESEKRAYYVTEEITIRKGTSYEAVFNLELELYNSTPVNEEVDNILNTYSGKFNTDINLLLTDIKSTISKISNIKSIKNLTVDYRREDGTYLDESEYKRLELSSTYFIINPDSTQIITNVI